MQIFYKNIPIPQNENVGSRRSRSFKTRAALQRSRSDCRGPAVPIRGTVLPAIFILCALLKHCLGTVLNRAWSASAHSNCGIAHEYCQTVRKQY